MKVVSLLALTFKGLTVQEICDIAQVERGNLMIFLSIFKSFCFNFKSFWKITNMNVLRFCEEKLLSQSEHKKALHRQIVDRVRRERLSLRKLEEMTIHLFLAEEYFSLKQTLCLIENFLLLNNENTKMLLHEFWRKLEQKGYDLVQEYNKSLEIFDIRFMPSDKDIFLINIQLCQFFKGALTRILRNGRRHHSDLQAPFDFRQDRHGPRGQVPLPDSRPQYRESDQGSESPSSEQKEGDSFRQRIQSGGRPGLLTEGSPHEQVEHETGRARGPECGVQRAPGTVF